MNFTVTQTRYRSHTRIAVGTVVDGYLDEDETEKVYKRWKDSWPEQLAFSGNQKAVTFEMIREIPQAQLNRTFGKKLGQKLTQYAEEYGD